MTFLCLFLLAGSGRYFTHATLYDAKLGGLREDMYVLLDASGKVTQVSKAPLPVAEGVTVEDGVVLLPLLSDFYTLIQERGLGKDEDIEPANQARLARYLCRIGIRQLRDPVFPPLAMAPLLSDIMTVYPCRGYLELPDGPAAEAGLIVDPQLSLEYLADRVPERGPITLWWTSFGTGKEVLWPEQRALTEQILAYFKEKGRKVGAYIQDAGSVEMAALSSFSFDFYEGMPAATVQIEDWPQQVVWVPLAALNDRRYCAWNLGERLTALKGLGLYEEAELDLALKAVPSVRDRISARCQIWREDRETYLEPLRQWLAKGRKIALGSGGGHGYCFSGDLNSELTLLESLGAGQAQLLEAAFLTTPSLLGQVPSYLELGAPANLLVYKRRDHWVALVGTKVDLSIVAGREATDQTRLPLAGKAATPLLQE